MFDDRRTVLDLVLPAILAAALATGCAAGQAKRPAPVTEPPRKAGPTSAASTIPVVAVLGTDGEVRRVRGPGPVIAKVPADKPDRLRIQTPRGKRGEPVKSAFTDKPLLKEAISDLDRAIREAAARRSAGAPGSPPATTGSGPPAPPVKKPAAGRPLREAAPSPTPPPADPAAAGIEVAVETVRGMRTWMLPPGRWRALAWTPDGALTLTPAPAGPRLGVGLMVRNGRESMVVSVAGREVEVARGGAAEVTVARPDGGMERMAIFLPGTRRRVR